MFRFTIRDVLWLMVVVGLTCGWWLGEKHWRANRWEVKAKGLEAIVEADGYGVEWADNRVEVRQPGKDWSYLLELSE